MFKKVITQKSHLAEFLLLEQFLGFDFFGAFCHLGTFIFLK
jgi:hypothetical protein